jgi:hypothetical protein
VRSEGIGGEGQGGVGRWLLILMGGLASRQFRGRF